MKNLIQKKILFVYGTRPEAIKLAPLIHEFCQCEFYITKVCVTGQHRQMLDQVNQFFNVSVDYDLDLMKPNQDLFDISSFLLIKLKEVLVEFEPDFVFVQGDTTSVLFSALASFYFKFKIVHIEAGLRSGNLYSPFPEEANRRLTSVLSNFHFCPTMEAKNNLKLENIVENVFVVGNTVIDALFLGLRKIENESIDTFENFFSFLNPEKKIILVTGHRRENFGDPFEEICSALKYLAAFNSDIQILFPVHLNPNVRVPVNKILAGVKNVFLLEPLDYPHLIWLMKKSYLILTDSGGIQEEGPSLNKPILVMRDVTERMEGVNAGAAKLIGTKRDNIINSVQELLENDFLYQEMSSVNNPYGDGFSSKKIKLIFDRIVLVESKE